MPNKAATPIAMKGTSLQATSMRRVINKAPKALHSHLHLQRVELERRDRYGRFGGR